MTALNFPSNPTVNDTYIIGGKTYTWNGVSWNAAVIVPQGPTGYTGSASTVIGPMGYTGSQGDIGYTGSQGIQGITGDTGYTGSQGVIGYTGSVSINDASTTSLTDSWSASKCYTEIGYIGSALSAIIG